MFRRDSWSHVATPEHNNDNWLNVAASQRFDVKAVEMWQCCNVKDGEMWQRRDVRDGEMWQCCDVKYGEVWQRRDFKDGEMWQRRDVRRDVAVP